MKFLYSAVFKNELLIQAKMWINLKKYYVERRKMGMKEYMFYPSIYMKSKNRKNTKVAKVYSKNESFICKIAKK